MKNSILTFLISFVLLSCNSQKKILTENPETSTKKEILLVGTFHYNNPGADAAKTKSLNILNENSQAELKQISSKIKQYNPRKIFVEWPHNEQRELDSLYQLYIENKYFQNDSLSDFYLKNEIFQLAFRIAKENNLKTVYGIDYSTSFPLEEVMNAIEEANQSELKESVKDIFKWAEKIDNKIESGISLTGLTFYINSPEFRNYSNNWHNNLMLLAGNLDDFSGPLLTSEWFKRNLYMWSLIQKNTIESDERIMVLVGGSHAAILELFIKENDSWQVKELEQIMKK